MQTSPLEQCLSEEVLIWLRFNLLKTTAAIKRCGSGLVTKYFQWVFDSLFLSREMCPFWEPQTYIPAFDVVTLA